jgi:hypothetical protein
MEKYLRLFAALERIFGKGYVSRLMGKQSNVITLPDKQARKFLDTELNVMEASEGAVKKGVQDLNNLVSDTKRLSTLNDQELLTITNNAERLAVKVNPPAPPPAPTADVLSITTKVNKNKDPNVLIDEYNKNQTRLRLTDDEGGTAISYDEFRKLQSRNNEIEKTLESLNVKPALDEVKPEGIVIPFTKKTEDFATGGRVGMAKGGITALKTLIKFLAKTRGHGSTKGSKSLQAVNPKQFGYKFDMLDPEMKDAINKNRLEYLENLSDVIKADKKLLREMKDLPKEWQDFMYKQANEGGNKGRLDIYNKINIDDAIGDIEQMKKNLEFKDIPGKEIQRKMNAEGGSQGLDYLMGIERRGYANGDYAVQAGIKNYLGKQKTATVPIKWKSGKDHPDTELAYITKPEKDLLLKLDMHNSMPDGEPNIGPGGIISLNSGGSGDVGADSAGPSDTGGESSYTDYSDADIGPMGLSAQGVVSPENYNLVDEATAKANLQSVVDNMKAKMTKDMDFSQRAAFNLSANNPFTSNFEKIGNFFLSPIGTTLSSFSYNPDLAGDRRYTDYGNTSSYFTGDESGGGGRDESDGGGRDERKFIPSFDTTLLTPDLDKNRDYRLYQGANNPFYSMQAVPSGGIKNVYTEFQTGGRVGFKKGSFLINTAIDAAKNLSKKKSKKPNLKRQMTREEIEDFADEYGIDPRDEYYTFDGTLADAKRILKESQDEYAYMYQQYKMGKLNPVAGEKTQNRLNFLRKKAEEAEMTSDKRLFSTNEMKELKDLEETFSPMGTSNKINISDPKTAESFTEFAKQNDPEGFKKIQKIVDDINNKNTLENFDITGRKKNAGGGLNYLMGL